MPRLQSQEPPEPVPSWERYISGSDVVNTELLFSYGAMPLMADPHQSRVQNPWQSIDEYVPAPQDADSALSRRGNAPTPPVPHKAISKGIQKAIAGDMALQNALLDMDLPVRDIPADLRGAVYYFVRGWCRHKRTEV